MEWFDYLKRTSITQVVSDWREYRKLKKALYQAEKDMVMSGVPLVRHYGIDDNIGAGNACIKSKQLVDGFFDLFNEVSSCAFDTRRCSYFAPEGAEKKCPNNLCVMWRDNNRYCENVQKYNDLKMLCSQYWSNKFSNVK